MLTGPRPYLLLCLLCLAVFLPGLAVIPPLDRDESRYAQATRQMLETGDVFDLRFQDDPRYKKPHAAYWLQGLAVLAAGAVTGDAETPTIWPHRLPSVAGAVVAVLLTFAVGVRLFDRPTALLGATILCCSVLVILEAHQAKTDALLLATVVAAQAALARIWLAGRGGADREDREDPGRSWLLFWLALAAGVLVKGPITPMIAALTIAALVVLDRNGRWLGGLRPLKGLAVFAGIVGPWALATWIATDGAFFATALGGDLAPKLAGGHESHGAPPGYHLALLIPLLWPGSLLLLPAIARAWRDRDAAAVRFCLAWIVPAWVVFEAIPTKLPHYTVALYPAIALLMAWAVLGAADDLARAAPRRWPAKAGAVLWAIVAVGLAAAAVAAPIVVGDGLSAWSLIPAAAALAGAGLVLRLVWQSRLLAATLAGLGLGAVAVASTLHLVLPRLADLAVSPAIAAAVRAIDPDRTRPVVIAGYAEPSVVFLLGTDTELAASGAAAAAAVNADPATIAVIEAREQPAFAAAVAHPAAAPAATVTGLNYSKGNRLDLQIIAKDTRKSGM